MRMTNDERAVAEQAIQGAREAIARGELRVNGVQIKALRLGNALAIFPPGVGKLVHRYLRGC